MSTAPGTAAPTTSHAVAVCVSKDGDARFMGHLDFQRLLERSLRRSGLPVQYTQGFNPRLCLSFTDALPVGLASEGEWVALKLTEDLQPAEVGRRLAPALPESVRLVAVAPGPVPSHEETVSYRLPITAHARSASDALQELLDRDEYTVADPRRDRRVEVRSLIDSAETDAAALVVRFSSAQTRPILLQQALTELCEEAGRTPPGFGPAIKRLEGERRPGEHPWLDDAAATARDPSAPGAAAPETRATATGAPAPADPGTPPASS